MIEILRDLGLPIGISTVSGRIDEIIVRITILSYAYYFYDYCIPWISLLYMILSYYVFKGKFPKFSNIIHSSFHIVTGFTMIYLIHCI